MCVNEIQTKQVTLQKKGKELHKNANDLQRKENKLERRFKLKAKRDLKAASILRKERKKLIYALDAIEKSKKSKCRKLTYRNSTNKNVKFPIKTTYKRSQYPLIIKNKIEEKMRKSSKKDKKVHELTRIFRAFCVKVLNKTKKYIEVFYSSGRPSATSSSTRKKYWEDAAGDCYLMSLKRTPQLWVYHRWPHFYPEYLNARAQWRNFGLIILFISGILFWTPCFLCLELCKCFFCACCYDN